MASADSSRGTHTETSAWLFLAETQSVNGGGARSDRGDEDTATVLPWLRRKRRKQECSLPSNSNQARTSLSAEDNQDTPSGSLGGSETDPWGPGFENSEAAGSATHCGPLGSSSLGMGAFFDNILHTAQAESTRSRLKLPWEVDAYKGIFGSLSDTSTHAAPTPIWVPVPQLDRESLEHKPAPKDLSMPDMHRSKPLVLFASLSAGSKDGPDEWYTKRAHCIQQWCDVISIRPQSWYIVPGTDTADLDEDDLYLSVDACFGVKSIYTLHKRLGSFRLYITWAKGQNLSAFPLDEKLVWTYLQHIKDQGLAASRATSFLEAVGFARAVLGMQGAHDVVVSRRVKGLSQVLLSNKAALKQAAPLTVAMVQSLHATLTDDSIAVFDRFCAGTFLFATYARCRWSDLAAVVNLSLDMCQGEGFLECQATKHKGSRQAMHKAWMLPLIAPARGVTGEAWAPVYMYIRKRLHLHLTDEPQPLFPVPVDEQCSAWRTWSITSSCAGSMLRRLVGNASPAGQEVKSHSLKSTTLSWAAKRGLSDDTRAILGRHSSATSSVVAVYSRDLSAAPLREFQSMIDEIRVGSFSPDSTRSGMILQQGTDIVQEQSLDRKVDGVQSVDVLTSDDEPSPSGSSSDSSASSSEDAHTATMQQVLSVQSGPTFEFFRHPKSGVVHKVSAFQAGRFECGRKLNASHKGADEGIAARAVQCKACFK